jgi:hypothetical protein
MEDRKKEIRHRRPERGKLRRKSRKKEKMLQNKYRSTEI